MTTQTDLLTPFAEGLWLAKAPVSIVGMKLTTTMTVLRLDSGDLLLYSPIQPTPALREAVDAIGPVAHLYAPNTFHHMSIGEWADLYPDATLHAPAGLAKKRADLTIDRRHHEAPEPAFGDSVEEHPLEGFRLEESALFHRPSGTLLVADLVHNIGRPEGGWTKFYTKAMGFYDKLALSRMIRWTAFADKAAARRSVDALLAQPFDRLIVGHGEPIPTGANDALKHALAWLS